MLELFVGVGEGDLDVGLNNGDGVAQFVGGVGGELFELLVGGADGGDRHAGKEPANKGDGEDHGADAEGEIYDELAARFGNLKPGMADAEVAEELIARFEAAGDLAEDDTVWLGDGFAVWVNVEGDGVGVGEGCPGKVAFGGEPFEVDMVVFVVLGAVAEAGFDVDAQAGMVWAGGGEEAVGFGVGFDDEGAFDDFDDVVEGVVYALDEGAADVEVDAAGEEKKKDGGDGGVPEGEASAGGLEHLVDRLPVSCVGKAVEMPKVGGCDNDFCIVLGYKICLSCEDDVSV